MPIFTQPSHEDTRPRPTRSRHRLWSLREVTDAQGLCHVDAGSPVGGQFTAKKACGTAASGSAKADSSLHSGSVTNASALGGGVNASLMVELEDGTKAVFKPERGEAWNLSFANHDIRMHVTNKALSLAEREAMASEVDQMLGLGIVPETVHRTDVGVDLDNIEVEQDDDSYDEDTLREMYDEYRQENLEKAQEAAGEEMYELYGQAVEERVNDIKARADEMAEIWNDLIDEHPEFDEESPYGSRSARAEHPRLDDVAGGGVDALFDKDYVAFDRKERSVEVVDPLEVLKDADVDVTAPMNREERENVRSMLLSALRNGADTLGDVDEDKAREHLDYGEWVQEHGDTEEKLIDKQLLDFEDWVEQNGYRMGGDHTIRLRNDEAPHPAGGSLQRFIEDLSESGNIQDDGDYHKFAALDYLIGAMDRHAGNIMFADDKPIAIDNGYSFPNAAHVTYRSDPVRQWQSYGNRNPDIRETPHALREHLLARATQANWQAFLDAHPSMDVNERTAFELRLGRLQIALREPTGLYDLWERIIENGNLMR